MGSSALALSLLCGQHAVGFKNGLQQVMLQPTVNQVSAKSGYSELLQDLPLIPVVVGAAVSESTWHNIVAWSGKDTQDIDRIEKGVAVHVTGRLRTNRYTSSDGAEKLYYEVMANKVTVLDE